MSVGVIARMPRTAERAEREYCSLASRHSSDICPAEVTCFSSCKYMDMINALPIVDSSQQSGPNGHKCIACWCVSKIGFWGTGHCSASDGIFLPGGHCYAVLG
jgi:hypothetical protein